MKDLSFCIFTVLLVAAVAFSCSKTPAVQPVKLAAPVPWIESQTGTTFKVAWGRVADATVYTWRVEDTLGGSTADTTAMLKGFKGGTYKVRVMARTANEAFSDSPWGETSVTLTGIEIPDFTIEVTVPQFGTDTAVVSCLPTDTEATYLAGVVLKSEYGTFGDADAFAASILAGLSQSALEERLVSGQYEFVERELAPQTEYVAYAFGVMADGTRSAAVATAEFVTATQQ